mmetsp:Transcript_17617/g.20392  ORF Transcript_17617/g.20392 Transcript_17617/m.20392 type:complete len:353 (-) Transcript_17617:100-1158(-)
MVHWRASLNSRRNVARFPDPVKRSPSSSLASHMTESNEFGHHEHPYILSTCDLNYATGQQCHPVDEGYIQWLRMQCGKFVNNIEVQKVIVFLIFINAIITGVATFDFVTKNPALLNILEHIDMIFMIMFTAEMFIHLIYRGYHLFMDGWLTFDFLVIAVSWMSEAMQVIGAFRILRALRLIIRVKKMRNRVEALLHISPHILAVAGILFLLFYIFSVMMTYLFRDLYDQGYLDEDYFSSLDRTFFTLFQILTLDNWSDIVRQVEQAYQWAWIPLLTFILASCTIFTNLVVDVICEAVSKGQRHEIESQLTHVYSDLGEQNDDKIEELEKKIDHLTSLVNKLLNEKQTDLKTD